jgi:acyl dehydratase
MAEITIANVGEYVGRELGVSDWLTVDQAMINQFAECSGDRQWIHVDVERATRESPYGGPIAHGYLSLSFLAPLLMQVGAIPKDAAAALNYGLDKVRFLAPVKAGARVRLRVVLGGVERRPNGQIVIKTSNTLEIEGTAKPALIAESLALVVPEKTDAR